MTIENSIRLLAGTLILISLSLGYFVSPFWYLLNAFVGVNLVQSSLTRWCLSEKIIYRLFYKNRKTGLAS